jgi:hypothetical protein
MNKKLNLDSMSVDEMWRLHAEIGRILSVRLTSEKRELEKRLEQLRRDKQVHSSSSGVKDLARTPRRKYPRVYPKYQKSSGAVRDVVWPRKDPTLAGGSAQDGSQARGVRD